MNDSFLKRRFSNKNLVVLQRAGYAPMFNLLGSLNMNGKDLERFVDGFGGPNAHYLKMPAHLYDDDCTDEQVSCKICKSGLLVDTMVTGFVYIYRREP